MAQDTRESARGWIRDKLLHHVSPLLRRTTIPRPWLAECAVEEKFDGPKARRLADIRVFDHRDQCAHRRGRMLSGESLGNPDFIRLFRAATRVW